MIEIEVDGLTEAQGEAVEAACDARGAWPVLFSPGRHRGVWEGPQPPRLDIPEFLGDEAIDLGDEESEAFVLGPDSRPKFAAALRILSEHLSQGFAIRVTGLGGEVRRVQALAIDDLVDLALALRLDEHTRYVVPPRRER